MPAFFYAEAGTFGNGTYLFLETVPICSAQSNFRQLAEIRGTALKTASNQKNLSTRVQNWGLLLPLWYPSISLAPAVTPPQATDEASVESRAVTCPLKPG